MPTTQQLTVTLPVDLVEKVRSLIAKGDFESESDAIENALVRTILFRGPTPQNLDRWVVTEGVRRCEALDADPSRALSDEQAWKFLDDEEESEEQTAA